MRLGNRSFVRSSYFATHLAIPFALVASFAHSVQALEVTAATLFGCDGLGSLDPSQRFNSGPIDGAWDLFVYRAEDVDPSKGDPSKGDLVKGDPSKIEWLTRTSDHSIRLPLALGRNSFAFRFDGSAIAPRYGLNLFFEGRNGEPAISAVVETRAGLPSFPKFQANSAPITMGWPLSEVPAAGSLVFEGRSPGLWSLSEAQPGRRATLTEFSVSAPAAGGLDLVGPHEMVPSGRPDFVGRFTIEVSEFTPESPEFLSWLERVAGMKAVGRTGGAGALLERDPARISPPFSLVYGGEPSRGRIETWKRTVETRPLDGGRGSAVVTYTDPETGLRIAWEGVEYPAFHTVEWVLRLENTGVHDTPIISELLALDLRLERGPRGEFLLHHHVGSPATKADFGPIETVLGPGCSKTLAGAAGRPSGQDWPYVNLESGGDGLIIAFAWPGQWSAAFRRDGARGLDIRSGQELTHFTLHPGEKVRTPRIVLQSWKGGDWIDAQNTWRRWMIAHVLPRPGGRLPSPQFAAASSHFFAEMAQATDASQIEFIDRCIEEKIGLDFWWMDAGWYPCDGAGWPKVGTWEVDRKRFPKGLRAVSDHAHAKGVKTIVWFEPERVSAGTWLTEKHPEWVLGGAGGGLLNLGNPQALEWLVDHVDRMIREEGIDLYRQDFNMDPLGFWLANDAEDRQGITEIRHVEGYLAYWDALITRHPGMLLDTCASGGRRDDLETLRRSVPLHRSDYILEPTGVQCHSWGLPLWVPFSGAGAKDIDPYAFRSNMHPAIVENCDLRDRGLDYDLLRKLVGEWRLVSRYYYADYYPLAPYSLSEDVWMAWQFHEPKLGEGFVQCFRRRDCAYFGLQICLRGLEPGASYELRNVDETEVVTMSGEALLSRGLRVSIDERPGAAVIVYRKTSLTPTP